MKRIASAGRGLGVALLAAWHRLLAQAQFDVPGVQPAAVLRQRPVGATNAATSASTLPFTGLDVVLLVAGGGTLLGAGFVVRRLSRTLD